MNLVPQPLLFEGDDMTQKPTKLIVIRDDERIELTAISSGSADPGAARAGDRIRLRARGVAHLEGAPPLDVDVEGDVTVQSIGRDLVGDVTMHLTPMEGFESVTKGECFGSGPTARRHPRRRGSRAEWGCSWYFESPPC